MIHGFLPYMYNVVRVYADLWIEQKRSKSAECVKNRFHCNPLLFTIVYLITINWMCWIQHWFVLNEMQMNEKTEWLLC